MSPTTAGSVDEQPLLHRFVDALARIVHEERPEALSRSITVAELYQDIAPYRRMREMAGMEIHADYEHALIRFLAGEGGFARLDPETAADELGIEAESSDPDLSLYRKFAACDVRLTLARPAASAQTVDEPRPAPPPAPPRRSAWRPSAQPLSGQQRSVRRPSAPRQSGRPRRRRKRPASGPSVSRKPCAPCAPSARPGERVCGPQRQGQERRRWRRRAAPSAGRAFQPIATSVSVRIAASTSPRRPARAAAGRWRPAGASASLAALPRNRSIRRRGWQGVCRPSPRFGRVTQGEIEAR